MGASSAERRAGHRAAARRHPRRRRRALQLRPTHAGHRPDPPFCRGGRRRRQPGNEKGNIMMRSLRSASGPWRSRLLILAAGLCAAVVTLVAPQQAGAGAAASAGAPGTPVAGYHGLSPAQRASLLSIAKDTWKFYGVDVDPATNLPMDNLTFAGGSAAPTTYGRYTSAANIGVYLWAVVSARDLGLISTAQAADRIQATLTEVQHLQRYDGFLYQWYDTTNGDVLSNPGDADCAANAPPAFTNCFF